MIKETRDPLSAAEEAVEMEEVVVAAEKEVEVKETKPTRKEIVVNNMMDSIYGKSVQKTGTAQPIKLEEEKMEVVVAADAVAVVVEDMVNRAFTTNTIHK